MKVHFTRVSSNVKTGPIPVSTSSADTCPTCSLKGAGCYAENFPLKVHFDQVTAGTRGAPWDEFLAEIRRMPKHQLWRHNQAGDLQGADDIINAKALRQLVQANKQRKGFSYTHYPPSTHNLKELAYANLHGFTINISADSLTEADEFYGHDVPVVAVVPPGWRGLRSPAGNPVTVCPAQVRDDMNCATCQLCQNATRKAIVAFEAHGARRNTVIRISKEKA